MAYWTINQPNCTLPTQPAHYIATPNIRSTLDIFWTSLATIIACTYSVLHLNVPEQRNGQDLGLKGDLKWGWRNFLSSAKWTAIACFAPEVILAKSFEDWIFAREQLRALHASVPRTKRTITMTHMLFAAMGGFVVSYPDSNAVSSPESEPKIQDISSTDTHATAANGVRSHEGPDSMNDLTESQDAVSISLESEPRLNQAPYETQRTQTLQDLEVGDAKSTTRTVGSSQAIARVDPATLRTFFEEDLPHLEVPSTDVVMDRSKSDILGKTLTVAQITYFLLEMIVRSVRRLPISQLELGVAGFVTCSFVTYCFSMSKPKGVLTAVCILHFGAEGMQQRARDSMKKNRPLSIMGSDWDKNLGSPYRNDSFWPTFIGIKGFEQYPTYWPTAIGSSIIMGAVHIVGWNYEFTTQVDLWLWRTSAIVSTVAIASLFIAETLKGCEMAAIVWFGNALTVVSFISYPLSRLILIVEMFRCLLYLPTGAFVTTWTANIPHIG